MGVYPYFTKSHEKEIYYKKLFNSIEKIIYEDIPSTNKIKFENLSIFKKLIYKVIESKKTYQAKIDTLAKDLKISEPTLYTYLEILNKTGVFRAIYKYSAKQTKKPSKIFFTNINIAYALSGNLAIESERNYTRNILYKLF